MQKHTADISKYALYGEEERGTKRDVIHIEDIYSRAHMHDWNIAPHVHRQMFQLVYVYEGAAEARVDRTVEAITGPTAVVVPGSVVHGFTIAPETKGWVLTVPEQLLSDNRFGDSLKLIAPFLRDEGLISFKGSEAEAAQVNSLLTMIASEFQWAKAGQEQVMEWLVMNVLVLLRRQWDLLVPDLESGGRRKQLFTRFRELVEAHYKDHKPVTFYADKLALSQARLNRLCHNFTGKNAGAMVQDRLVKEAERYLIYTSATANMIAYELGFQDPAYFSRFFKRETGMTPGQYRKDVQK